MKNLIKLAVVVVLLQGCNPSASSSSLTTSVSSPTGSEKYEIQWSGTKGSEVFASYSILYQDAKTPMRAESIQAKLPHKVKFSTPQGAIVSAAGDTFGKGAVEIKIYKNGSECGKVGIVGTGIGANKVCE